MEAGDLIITPPNSPHMLEPYVVVEQINHSFWKIFFLHRQIYRTFRADLIERHIKSMNDGTQNVIRDR